jgi:hypothetical protein
MVTLDERPATRLEFVSARIELEILRVESSRVFIFRVESCRVRFFNKRNQKRTKKKNANSTRLDSKNPARLEKYFVQLDSTRAGLWMKVSISMKNCRVTRWSNSQMPQV